MANGIKLSDRSLLGGMGDALPLAHTVGRSATRNCLQEMLREEVQKLYSFEVLMLDALRNLTDAACEEDLRNLLEDHRIESSAHVRRLHIVCERLGFDAVGSQSQIAKAILAENPITAQPERQVKGGDAKIVATLQKVEYLEIASYGICRYLARRIGDHGSARFLEQTLHEEKRMSERLGSIAEFIFNQPSLC